MRIIIDYESSWRNSFLDGTNNEPLPKNGRKFIASMTELKKAGNYKEHQITKDTVMGILNRLIGDQRKLYQSRLDENYYFQHIESVLTDKDIEDHIQYKDQEMVFIRNISGSEDQNSFTGMIKTKDASFNSEFSTSLWGVLFSPFSKLVEGILEDDIKVDVEHLPELDPISVVGQLEFLNTLKAIELEGKLKEAYDKVVLYFPDVEFKLTAKGLFTPISLYTAALYIQLDRLSKKYDLSEVVTAQGGLSGISKRGFTKKDFMKRYTTGPKKLVWGNPYLLKTRVKGEGEMTQLLTKVTGRLTVHLNISSDEARDLENKIRCAGVSAFYLGKKGLAYVSDIRI